MQIFSSAYVSLSIFRVIKSMWMHWAGCVIAWFREITNVRTILVGKDHSGDLGKDRRIILKLFIRK
jgi:hypothetical protein